MSSYPLVCLGRALNLDLHQVFADDDLAVEVRRADRARAQARSHLAGAVFLMLSQRADLSCPAHV
jgi:hypothetical protein